MTYEFLPRPQPGQPSMRFPPGFADGVRQRIREYKRQKRRRRAMAMIAIGLCLLGGVCIISRRLVHDGRWPGIPQGQPGRAATPALNAGSAQQPASSRDTRKRETSVRAPVVEHAAGGPKEPATAVKTAPLQQQAFSQDTVKQGAAVPASVDEIAIASCQPCSAEVPAAKGIYVRRAGLARGD